jgi:hypothetical protein
MRIGMNGFAGLDVAACIPLLEARGIDHRIAALFLPYWEDGMMAAIEEKRKEKQTT